METAKRYLPYWGDRRAGPGPSMFCLPHLGGGASAFYDWTKQPGDVVVHPVQLPGREDLFGMPLVTDMAVLVDQLGTELTATARHPFVLFGHSMGAAIAAELTAWLHREGAPLPELLVVSSAPAPATTEAERRRLLLPSGDDEIIADVLAMGGTSPEVFGDEELRELMLEIVRNDVRLMAGYRPTFERLPVPVLALGGVEDSITEADLADWRHRTDGAFYTRLLPGGHFYLRDQIPAVLALVTSAVAGRLRPAFSEGGTTMDTRGFDGERDEVALAATLLTVIREELGSDRIGPDDDFYEQGGDSLIAVRVVTRVNQLGIALRLIDLLSFPSVTELVPNLPSDTVSPWHTTPAPDSRGLSVVGGEGAVRTASALQVGLIYQCEMSEDPSLYNDLIGLRVGAPFVEAAFRTALGELVERHSALRSSFDLGSYAESVQLLWPEVELPLEIELVTSGTGEAEVAAWRECQLATAFDWSRAPLFRCHVAVLDDSFRMTVAIHHAIMDGWSFATILVDLLALYTGRVKGQDAKLPPVPAHGDAAFSAAEREAVESAEAAAFWLAQADAPPLVTGGGRFSTPADASGSRELPFTPELFAGLKKAAAVARVPLKSLLLAVHCWALATWIGRSRDVVTGVVVNGRPEIAGADLLVGLFLNTVPIRLESIGGSWAELAAAAHGTELAGLAHRRYPLARIEEDLGRRCFDVAFNFTDFHVYRKAAALGIEVDGWWAVDKASHPVSCDYTVDFPGFGTGLIVTYDGKMTSADRVDELVTIVHSGLLAVARDIHGEVPAATGTRTDG